MDKKNNPKIAFDEIARRLKLAEEWLPPIYAEPAEEKWKYVTAFLLQDDKIFKRFMTISSLRMLGREKATEINKKYNPYKLIKLADDFDSYHLDLKRQANQKNISIPTQKSAIKSFKQKYSTSLKWLPRGEGTIERLIILGRSMKNWPELMVDGTPRLVHPLQSSAIVAINRQSFFLEDQKIYAINQILSLQFDRPGDIEQMQQYLTLFKMREISTGLPGSPIVKEQPVLKIKKVSTKK